MQKAILPLFWINEAIHLDVNTRNKLLSSVVSTSLTIKKVGIVTIVAGCLLWISFVIYATVMMLFPMRFDDEEQLVAHDDGIIDENQIIDGN
ncbi:unnamed protein product [Dracunculus medinensis]|uniref:Col_cuticle_N domain-containing protein n=1 Tax=Dracunculus medinensis TaxID=318479 RepID=A0A0N4UA97_DRAME|nr:unnamed protein product [Dracunculus medinensis]